MTEHSGQTKISQLCVVLTVQEYIGWLQISVKDHFAVLRATMALFQGEYCLVTDLPNEFFLEVAPEKERERFI